MKKEFYKFDEQNEIAKRASADVTDYIKKQPATLLVTNVEDDPKYQFLDIDLLVLIKHRGSNREVSVEIKGDTYFDKSNNYFFEVMSNDNKQTQGCFFVSQADFMFYYFMDKEIHIFNLKEAQGWLQLNSHRFTMASAPNEHYNSFGLLVPRHVFANENRVKVVHKR